ncbi:MAG: hypothetical protein J0652_00840 [Desulfobulbaceae bacterium]|nr:hypothetical protein [Desulfobulbaceae bacterium]
MIKKISTSIFTTGVLACSALMMPQIGSATNLADYSMPVSNPVYNGDARNVTMVRPIMIFHSLPDDIKTSIGDVNLGGDITGMAVQLSYAFSDRLSLVAVKDGYFDLDADRTLQDDNGWADIAAGLQYSFIHEPKNNFIMTGRLVYEAPVGDDDIFQGNGDGNLAPAILFLKGWDKLQFSGTVGLVLPLDTDEENTLLYDSWNLSYAVTDVIRPLIELNHFHVLNSGDRNISQALSSGSQDDLVAAITTFNGVDIINLGGEHNDDNTDLVTLALGSRFRINKWLDLGAAYEIPLTNDDESLIKNRFTVDAVFTMAF